MRMRCRRCGWSDSIDPAIVTRRHRAGLDIGMRCPGCGSTAEIDDGGKRAAIRENLKRSRKQETRVAAREGARRQPASGSRPGYEGDVRKLGAYRGECKFTRAQSYSLKLETLRELEMQANYGELPILDLEFQVGPPHRRYVVMPEWAYETLMKESGRRGDHDRSPTDPR